MVSNNVGKGPIYVTGADGQKGSAIVNQLLELPKKYKHIVNYPIYAAVPTSSTAHAQSLEKNGATVIAVNLLDHQATVRALQGVAKLCLVVDPLSTRLTRDNIFDYAKRYIDCAIEANVNHIVFLSPFSPLLVSPPTSPQPQTTIQDDPTNLFRTQFGMIETYLRSRFTNGRGITVLYYPGLLHQHLVVFGNYIRKHNAFPLPSTLLENTVESSNLLDIARATATVLYSPTSRFANNDYRITGPQLLTLQEVSARVLSGLKKDHTIDGMDVQNLTNVLRESVGNDEHVQFLMEMWGLQRKLGGRRFEVTRDLEALTGQSGKTLNEFFEDQHVIDSFMAPTQPFLLAAQNI
ncbi:hypothetical protein J3Q64DRAFT_1769303 [Phycomyces blakesleeanus]|uniref:NmrA-like domain-containing protein n=2 Tax=Phycomyces blakesleeanus TaxID=4837 RepID=A0A163A1N9_PHYB8|nr:hypothetical protein PHYBLDRAFT_159534 [Phycomyces blakesleeanus NRRL 1555(-)]OAD70471.1 hypothetical protein PHYBLDRAFT_159534 [Phycomyces blakesleeanus NRRL 1555(-)]|eukprot:XP_018288511.1 hypothetical protein PHYBLDRAFT_159534 [Phycomyces blakesleeanus NRRL 1555(-)]